MRRARSWLAAVVAVVLAALPAAAQPTTVRIRGQVTALERQVLVVSTRTGEPARITLAPRYQVLELTPVAPATLRPGSVVSVVGERLPDNRMRALAVLVYPRGARLPTEGNFPWDLTERSTMTHATVRESAATQEGRELVVTYRAERLRVVVGAGVPVVTHRQAPARALRRGANVFLIAAQFPDDTLTAARVMVGRGGMIPPL